MGWKANKREKRKREWAAPWIELNPNDHAPDPELTPEQRAEVDRRIEAHAERVQREMQALGLLGSTTK